MNDHRMKRVREALQRRGLDGFLVTSLLNIRYLTGFTGTNALLIISSRNSILLTDVRYALQAKHEVGQKLRVVVTRNGLYAEAARRGLLQQGSTFGFEAHQVTYAHYRTLRKLFPGVSFASTRDLVEEIMLVKDEEEIASIRRAAKISDRVFNEVRHMIRPGVRELEVAAEISYLHRRYGAEGDAFEIIVASGERSALPHARASSKHIRSGELVTLDFGCVVNGYHSDITRTICVEKASRRARQLYEAVLDAQRAAIESARAGMWARDLDAVARKRIVRAGLGTYFQHSLGHGLGLHVHERPRVSRRSTEQLKAGSVITIEPGVYIPGFGGVRIEDDVLLHDTGCELLSNAPKDFVTV